MDPTTGCRGCASGVGQPRNIFGNKYGQNLAAVQIARELRMKEIQEQQQQRKEQQLEEEEIEEGKRIERVNRSGVGGGDSETESDDDDDDDDYGPTPAAGVWAADGSKLERLATANAGDEGETKRAGGGCGDSETEDDDDVDNNEDISQQPTKKLRM
jgi:hypothetical protein